MTVFLGALGALTAVTSLAATLVGLVNHRRIDEVHVLVNSRLHEVIDRADQLVAALEAAGVDVPDAPTGDKQ